MPNNQAVKFYSPLEEGINVYSHVLGIVLSIIGLVALIILSTSYGDVWQLVSVSIYGISLIMLFTASSVYHASKDAVIRSRLRVFDHASIYIMIAGAYTPFTLITLSGAVGRTIFGITWGMAIIGIVLKVFYTGRFKILSTAMYLLMGWMIVFAIQPLVENIAPQGINLLITGGWHTHWAQCYTASKPFRLTMPSFMCLFCWAALATFLPFIFMFYQAHKQWHCS